MANKTITTSCHTCKKTTSRLQSCSRCKSVKYCDKECQKKDWKEHKKTCVSPSVPAMLGLHNVTINEAKSDSDAIVKLEYKSGKGFIHTGNKGRLFGQMCSHAGVWMGMQYELLMMLGERIVLGKGYDSEVVALALDVSYQPEAGNPAARFPVIDCSVMGSRNELKAGAEDAVVSGTVLVREHFENRPERHDKSCKSVVVIVRVRVQEPGLPDIIFVESYDFANEHNDHALEECARTESSGENWLQHWSQRAKEITAEGQVWSRAKNKAIPYDEKKTLTELRYIDFQYIDTDEIFKMSYKQGEIFQYKGKHGYQLNKLTGMMYRWLDIHGFQLIGTVLAGLLIHDTGLDNTKYFILIEATYNPYPPNSAAYFPITNVRVGTETDMASFAEETVTNGPSYVEKIREKIVRNFTAKAGPGEIYTIALVKVRLRNHGLPDTFFIYANGIVERYPGSPIPPRGPSYEDVVRTARRMTTEGLVMVYDCGAGRGKFTEYKPGMVYLKTTGYFVSP